MYRHCNGCDSQNVEWQEPSIPARYCGDCAEERSFAGMIEIGPTCSHRDASHDRASCPYQSIGA